MKEKLLKRLKTALWLVPLLVLTVMVDRGVVRMTGDHQEAQTYARQVEDGYRAVFEEEAPAMRALYASLQQTIAQPDATRYAALQQSLETAITNGRKAYGNNFCLRQYETAGGASFFYWGTYLTELQEDVAEQNMELLPEYAAVLEKLLPMYEEYALADDTQKQTTSDRREAVCDLYQAMSELSGPTYQLSGKRYVLLNG